MVQVRILIEGSDDIYHSYKTTKLYCDWMLHRDISLSSSGLLMIHQLTEILFRNWSNGEPEFIKKIAEVFKLDDLRNELQTLFKTYKIPTFLFDTRENWRQVSVFILFHLREKRISRRAATKYNKSELQSICDSIDAIPKPDNFYIKNVIITGKDAPECCIQLDGKTKHRVIAPLHFCE